MPARSLLAAVASCFLAATLTAPALAAPRAPRFGPALDPPAGYQGQSRCSPAPKPGVVAFQRMVVRAYPWTGVGSIARACSVGGTSEHKEGRAWDWGVDAGSQRDRDAVADLMAWLLAPDAHGNAHALARRLGIMYVIWNRRIWSPWGGWRTYCVQRRRGCVDPDDGGLRHPHTDHVHFSFSWNGARKHTTFWHPGRSLVVAAATHPGGGLLRFGANGAVIADGAPWYGQVGRWLERPVVAAAADPGGRGYWTVEASGRVRAFGSAPRHGRWVAGRPVAIEPTPDGRGYWVATRGGRVHAFGDAPRLGGVAGEGEQITDMAATPSGAGYWLFASSGRVFAFGDAPRLGSAPGTPVVSGDNHGADGYWLATPRGRVLAFGSARYLGGGRALRGRTVALRATPSGGGYRLVTDLGAAGAFGDAG